VDQAISSPRISQSVERRQRELDEARHVRSGADDTMLVNVRRVEGSPVTTPSLQYAGIGSGGLVAWRRVAGTAQ
jgi:hypothetical protein